MMHAKIRNLFLNNRPITTEEASNILGISKNNASKLLHRLCKKQEIFKIKRGLYLPSSNKALVAAENFSDPFIVVPYIYPKSYIGGWSSLSYYGLTDQLFKDTCIMTQEQVHHKKKTIGCFNYIFFKHNLSISDLLAQDLIDFIWRNEVKVPISNIHKTIIDILVNPEAGAGITHVIDCFKIYMREYYEDTIFRSYCELVKNGTFFKRLGFIVEKLYGRSHPLCFLAKENITNGYSKIDNNMECNKLATYWNLLINREMVI
ncbi:MAG: hypothetical protein SFT68_04520 [Rickettsiaceae bacterium]|nr:hypothetical protein [Rickettsiaceae bacterium]